MKADFRSDTVTRPTAAMYAAMVAAPLGDDVFQDDPTVLELEGEVASLLGKEAAVFVTTGTLSNQLALRTHVGPLDEVLCDHRSHIHVWEVGGIHMCGASASASAPEPGERFLCAEAVRANTRSDHSLYHQPVTRLLALEQTLNGEVMPLVQVAAACGEARALGLATHLDGARLWNACAATGTPPAAYAEHFDTVSVCLSKVCSPFLDQPSLRCLYLLRPTPPTPMAPPLRRLDHLRPPLLSKSLGAPIGSSTYTHTVMHGYVYVCMYTHKHTHTHTYLYIIETDRYCRSSLDAHPLLTQGIGAPIGSYTHIHNIVYAYMFIYIYTHTHIYIYIYILNKYRYIYIYIYKSQ